MEIFCNIINVLINWMHACSTTLLTAFILTPNVWVIVSFLYFGAAFILSPCFSGLWMELKRIFLLPHCRKHKPVCFFNIHEHGINVRVWMSINIQGVMNVKPTQTGSIWAWCLFACRSVVRVFILTQSAFALAESPDCNNTTLKEFDL